MAPSLLGTIEEYLTSDVMQRAGAFLGESPADTEKAVQHAVPAILGGLIQRASTPDGAEALTTLIVLPAQSVSGANLTWLLNNGAAMEQSTEAGQPLLNTLFGGTLSAIADLVSSTSGVKTSSASTLLALLTPLVLTIVRREAAKRGGGAAGLIALLSEQKAEIMSFLPSGLSSLVTGLGSFRALAAGAGRGPVNPPVAGMHSPVTGALPVDRGQQDATGARRSASDSAGRGATDTVGRGTSDSAAGRGATDRVGRGASDRVGRAASDVGAAVSADASDVGARTASAAGAIGGAAIGGAAINAVKHANGHASGAADRFASVTSAERQRGWLVPLVLLALLGLGAWYFIKGQPAPSDQASVAVASTASPSSAPPTAAPPATVPANPPSATTATRQAPGTSSLAEKTADATKAAARKTGDVTKDAARKTGEVSKAVAENTADAGKTAAHKTGELTRDAASGTAETAKKVGEETAEGAETAAGAVAGTFNRLTGRDGNGTTTTVTLPGGKHVKVPEGGANYELAKYLEGGEASPKTFVFERLHFESGSARLTRGSRRTVAHLAAILKAYPSTEVRLDGHTDNTGDTEKNRKLSQARADAVKSMLERSGVSPTRLATSGYGPDKPIASNETPDGRLQNRRIELAVTKR